MVSTAVILIAQESFDISITNLCNSGNFLDNLRCQPPSGLSKVSPMPSVNSSYLPQTLRIAFTYDSKSEWLALGYSAEQCAEFDSDETIEGIATSLRKLGTVEMIGSLKSLTKILANSTPNWDIVFNICEGLGSLGREAQVPALLEGWGIPFTFSDSATLALCLDKAKTKVSGNNCTLKFINISIQMVLEHYGVPVAPFACIPPKILWAENFDPLSVIQNSAHREALNEFPLFLKPAAEGTGMGISQANKVANQSQLLKVLDEISKRYPTQTILIEHFLAGREFTIAIVGTGADAAVIGVRELVFLNEFPVDPTTVHTAHDPDLLKTEVFGYDLKQARCPNPQFIDMDLSSEPVAREVAKVALKAWNLLGCRDGGRIDIRHDGNGVPNFIEVAT